GAAPTQTSAGPVPYTAEKEARTSTGTGAQRPPEKRRTVASSPTAQTSSGPEPQTSRRATSTPVGGYVQPQPSQCAARPFSPTTPPSVGASPHTPCQRPRGPAIISCSSVALPWSRLSHPPIQTSLAPVPDTPQYAIDPSFVGGTMQARDDRACPSQCHTGA